MRVLLFNAGSSSLKCSLVESQDGAVLARGLLDWAGSRNRYQYEGNDGVQHASDVGWKGHEQAVRRFLYDLSYTEPIALPDHRALAAVGHRVVHGGEFTSSVQITSEVRSRIAALADLAPLHNPPSLATLAAAEVELPNVPQIATFDTAFHATLPTAAYTYPVPEQWNRQWKIRRYGFHGLSHAYCAHRATEMLVASKDPLKLVICHLGHGCSASAVCDGRCVDTTMGFTPLEGLMMATRSGSIDPGIVLHVQKHYGLSVEQMERALNFESGLLGVSGLSADMREIVATAQQGHARAQLALEIYTRRVRQAIGALAVTMGGIDALVFTAGVGENAGSIRESICQGLNCLGVELDAQANADCCPDMDIASRTSRCRVLVIAAREEVTMLREVLDVLAVRGQSNMIREHNR
jgi:acetate kinase